MKKHHCFFNKQWKKHHHFSIYIATYYLEKCGHEKLPYIVKPSLTQQNGPPTMCWISLLNTFTNGFLIGCFVLKTMLLMEPPTWGSLISTSTSMIKKNIFLRIYLTFFFPWCGEFLSCLMLFLGAILFQHSSITC